jgi:lysozyme
MKNFAAAIDIICRYQGFNEKAYADPETGGAPYTIGYGTQFYPDESPVLAGQMCTKEKALEYLKHELRLINEELDTVNLHLDNSMRMALLSFIHCVGWESFLYGELVDCIGNEDWEGVAIEMSRWIFDHNYQVIGNLIDRRREEIRLFLEDLEDIPCSSTGVLLAAFRNYVGAPNQLRAISKLEEKLNPYVLAEFANGFDIKKNSASSFWPNLDLLDYDNSKDEEFTVLDGVWS